MVYKVSRFVHDVRVALDMNGNNKSLLLEEDQDTLELDEIIRSKLADAVRQVEMEAPSALLEYGHDFAEQHGVEWGEDGKGSVLLPDDFMRFVSFCMSDWRRTVYTAITDQDPSYELLSSRYRGISGNPEKPVVAIVHHSEGLTLEFYSCDSEDAVVTQATYIPIPRIENGGIDVSERCYPAAVYRAAFLTLSSTGGEPQTANNMLEISKQNLV